MDIAKIRKKARQKEERQKSSAGPVSLRNDAEPPKTVGSATADNDSPVTPVFVPGPVQCPNPVQETGIGGPESAEHAMTGAVGSDDRETMMELLTFSLAGEEFAFPLSSIEEVIRPQRIRPVPKTPAHVRGITSLRGKIIPIIDLKRRLDLQIQDTEAGDDAAGGGPESSSRADNRGKILIVFGPEGPVGIEIEKVTGVMKLPATGLLAPPGHLNESGRIYIEGVIISEGRIISVLRADKTLQIEIPGGL